MTRERNEKGQFVYTTGKGRYKAVERNRKRIGLHRLVWETYNGPIPEGYIVHHINGNKLDNRLENLACITVEDHNKIHAKDRPIWNKGLSKKSSVKWALTLEKAKKVRHANLYEKCKVIKKMRETMSAEEIGKRIGLCTRQIHTLLHRYDDLRKEFENAL